MSLYQISLHNSDVTAPWVSLDSELQLISLPPRAWKEREQQAANLFTRGAAMVRAGRGVTAGEGSRLKAVSESQVDAVTMLKS